MEQISRLLGVKKSRRIYVPEIFGRLLAEFSEMRIRAFGNKAIFNRDKFNEMRHPAWVCSAAKIEAQLHFQPRVPLADALAETISWYRERGLL
jgi:nucleoside-diphosphate-sugar epimerase